MSDDKKERLDKAEDKGKKDNSVLRNIEDKVDKISLKMEHTKFNDYVNYLRNPRKMFWSNFLSGLFRGFGIAVGFTILTALVIFILQQLVRLNLPVISEFISKVVKLVEFYADKK